MLRNFQILTALLCAVAIAIPSHGQVPQTVSNDSAAQQIRAAEIAKRRALHVRGVSDRKPTEAEALAIAALRALMSAPPERALPLLERTLKQSQSDLVKARALFVLGQIDTPAARSLLLKNALELKGPLQLEAIRSVGIGGDTDSLKALTPIYTSGSTEQQGSVITALTIANAHTLLAELALQSKNSAQREEIVNRLAALGAVAELRKLATQGVTGVNLARAYAIAGDLESVLKIARNDPDSAARTEAIRSLGMLRSEQAKVELKTLYQSAKSPDEKAAALSGLLIAGDEAAVLSLYRATEVPTEKRELLRTLGVMGGDAALEAIDAALEGKAP